MDQETTTEKSTSHRSYDHESTLSDFEPIVRTEQSIISLPCELKTSIPVKQSKDEIFARVIRLSYKSLSSDFRNKFNTFSGGIMDKKEIKRSDLLEALNKFKKECSRSSMSKDYVKFFSDVNRIKK